ncbi:hypothetical protein N7510_000245 [Penicillium lagena]|uniref:uncharacterized protein n=1 Tax=Penicillium lagena TaxID=94218 RepID=UPI00254106E6|nr:uncharacterized protein N7510_000245 [Penicillium lagena]KAJ5623936.1 hypothetical protein N7510_000245 [Penicillium lagena]
MEAPFSMESADRSNRAGLDGSQMVVQQYARYPSTLESTLQTASSIGSARSQPDADQSPTLRRKGTPRSLQSSPRGMRSGLPLSSAARSGTSMSPPMLDSLRQQQTKDSADQVESRELPIRDLTDDTIDDAYVAFILYCNPNVPSSVDDTELRRAFRCPPRSDGKSFSVFTLFELIRKLDSGELKTWIQLATELGVEPPSIEKKQSTQKVQQYAVRLKRWMRAMHVDAFFEYCLDHAHVYYTQLPPVGPFVNDSRDGVPLEEDLALRALVPQWKPKRGRKRTEDKEAEDEKLVKRPQLDTSIDALHPSSFQTHSIPFPQSAIPFSAYPSDTDPWMTAASSFTAPGSDNPSDQQAQDTRWRLPDREASPSGYPHSAILPRGSHPSEMLGSTEPRSAMTPISGDKSRSKRRHGPAVSSAWPNSTGSSTTKGRGRPPNKSSSTGSFSSFQVNQNREPSHTSNPSAQSSPPVFSQNPSQTVLDTVYNQSPTPAAHARPGKLQLQVPQHSGGPVRLATPPTLLVNGVNGAVIPQAGEDDRTFSSQMTDNHTTDIGTARTISVDDVIRALSVELARARLSGRASALKLDEAHAIASEMVLNLSALYSQLPLGPQPFVLAFHLGVGHHFGFTSNQPGSLTVKVDPASADATGGGIPGLHEPADGIIYTISYNYQQSYQFSVQVFLRSPNSGTTVATFAPPVKPGESVHDPVENDHPADFDLDEDTSNPVSEGTWKQRYMRLRAQTQRKERAISQYKRRIVESVMADI